MVEVRSVNAPPSVRRYAVAGAGFAGVSLAWHLLQFANPASSISVELFDERGIGAGASGASGGLLHPFSPAGKLLWKGAEGFRASLALLAAAESTLSENDEPISWKRGILRPAQNQKRAENFVKNVNRSSDSIGRPVLLNAMEAKTLVPGLSMQDELVALHIRDGVNIDPMRYLEALWKACIAFAKAARESGSVGTEITLTKRKIASLSDLSADHDAIVICLGAKAAELPELQGKLPLLLRRGVTAQMELPANVSEHFDATTPSVLSRSWMAFQGQRRLILGGGDGSSSKEEDQHRKLAAPATLELSGELWQAVRQLYPRIDEWKLSGLRGGVRAMPPRFSGVGAVPLAGSLDHIVASARRLPRVWIFTGLGSRGLVYHAWLGRKVAHAVVLDNEEFLPEEARRWKLCREKITKINV